MMGKVTGGCLCGEIRYETTSEPALQCPCYCTDCQIISSAAGYAVYAVPIDSVLVTRGEPAHYDVQADSGRINSRSFCPKCGTRMWAQLDELGLASVNGLTLDNRDHFRPTSNHFPGSAPDWCLLDERLALLPPIPRQESST